MPDEKPKVFENKELNFKCEATLLGDGYIVEFKIREWTEYPKEELCHKVRVKWDGCSDWYLDYMHFCDLKDAEKLGKLARWLFEIAAELMPQHDQII